ncbi:MAG: PQQ-binding-like beta-propeller repeat protein [Armatimonadota bacterium]|nr:PQQ-like beta-propeller repeat protein [bacterium]
MIFRRAGLLAAIFVLASSAAFSADCLMGRYEPDQSGFTAEKLQLPVALNWEFTANKFDNNPAAPIVADGVCYFASGSNVYAIDLETGCKIWQYPADRPLSGAIKSTPAFWEDNLYFASVDGNMYCIDATTGVFKWAYQTRGPIRCSPVIDEGIIYIAADDNSVYSIDAETGEATWSKPFTARDDYAQGLAIGSGMLVAACMDGNMYGINESSGKLRWQFRMSGAPVRTSPMITNNQVVLALGSAVYGISVRGGQLKWFIKLPAEVAATPAANGMDIYIPCRDKKLYAYTLTTRQPTLKWTEAVDLGTLPTSSPTIADDTVYVTTNKGVVAAYSATDGSLKWRYIASPSQINSAGANYTDASCSPIVANNSLLVLTDDGTLHCFSPQAPDNTPPTDYNLAPTNAIAISGVPPIKMSAIVYDAGSGVDFSSVTLTLDGTNPLTYKTDLATSTISYETDAGTDGKSGVTLSNGVHTIKLTAKDYCGNELNREWFFFADNSLPPPKRVVKETGKTTKEKKTEKKTGDRRTRQPEAPPMPGAGSVGDSGSESSPPPPPSMPGFPSQASDDGMQSPPDTQ